MGATRRHRAFAAALALANALSMVCADLAQTYTMSEVLDWERSSEMQMSVSGADGDIIPFLYTVIPLTTDLGLNESQTDRGEIAIGGQLVFVDASNYGSVGGSDIIPYLCCDQMNNSFIQPDEILNNLMSNTPPPAAIVLYSQLGQCCGLAGQSLDYQKILTMPDRSAAAQVENITASAGGAARATITGNFTSTGQDQDSQQTGSNSAVAMSILYSITGLITLLFLVIIATGAVRAHRYPERYGPRNGFGGTPRQSRAKGLARAVLETLPIVKFGGDSQPATKPDPNIELEHATTKSARDAPHNGSERHLSTIPESPTEPRVDPEAASALRTSHDNPTASVGGGNNRDGAASPPHSNAASFHEEGLGCSICTEDFTLGEDVRVLPCNHKYHPQCVDPWLVNVSGTCPLCRLDLRPSQDEGGDVGNEGDENSESPPLGADAGEAGDHANSSRRRSRFFDLARLRYAPVEERIEALRQLRTEQHQGLAEDGHGRAKLSDRLRDRFRIRTRAAQQLPAPAGTSSAGQPPATANQSGAS